MDWRKKLSEPFVSDTESPIEQLLCGVLAFVLGGLEFYRFQTNKDFSWFIKKITPQLVVGHHRIDIAIVSDAINLAVECDGHDFHEKTKDQASRDKARKRALTEAGWTVIEFTGSEIWRDPFACAEQITDIILAAHEQRKNGSQG